MTPEMDAQHATTLDAAVTNLLASRDVALLPDVLAPDISLAFALIQLSAGIEPEVAFATALEGQLLAPGGAEASLEWGHGSSGNGYQWVPRRRRPSWRHWLPLAAMVLLTLLLLVPQARASMQALIH